MTVCRPKMASCCSSTQRKGGSSGVLCWRKPTPSKVNSGFGLTTFYPQQAKTFILKVLSIISLSDYNTEHGNISQKSDGAVVRLTDGFVFTESE